MATASALKGTVPLVGRQWKNAVVETAAYYQTYHPDEIDNPAVYKTIGEQLYAAYPSIKKEGNKPWVSQNEAINNIRSTANSCLVLGLHYLQVAAGDITMLKLWGVGIVN
jgi:hypothetical protein